MDNRGSLGTSLKPLQKRRLAAEQAIYRKYNNFRECADACQKYCNAKGLKIGWNRLSIQQFVGCQTNLSMKRLAVLADMLGITDYKHFSEVFTAPKHRGEGEYWMGEHGNRVRDLEIYLDVK